MEKNLYLIKKVSMKSGKEPFTYIQLYCDLGYGNVIVSMDKNVIAEILGVPVLSLYMGEVDKPVLVATLNKVEVKK